MNLLGIFNDYTDDGKPQIAIHDEDENYLFSVTIPSWFVEQENLEIGDECVISSNISYQKSS